MACEYSPQPDYLPDSRHSNNPSNMEDSSCTWQCLIWGSTIIARLLILCRWGPWGVPFRRWYEKNTDHVTVLSSVLRHIMPARWMGHRRVTTCRRLHKDLPTRRTRAWWRPGTFSGQHLRAYPSQPLGGKKGAKNTLDLRASYPHGRSWNSKVPRGTTWNEYKIALARDMKRERHGFDILYQGEILPENDHP